MSRLEGALAHHLCRKIDIEGTLIVFDIGIVDFKMLLRKSIWTVSGEWYVVKVTLECPFVHLGTQN